MTLNSQPTSDTRLTGRWLTLARLVWVVLAVGYLTIWLASLPGFYERVSTLTIEPFRLGERIIFDNARALREATQRGVSLQVNAFYDIGFDLLQVLVYYFVATVILWRTRNGFGWFTALVLMLFSVNNMQHAVGVARPFPETTLLIEIPAYIIWPLWIAWLALFPDGRTVPRRAFLPFAVAIALLLALQVANVLAVVGVLPPQIDTFSATTVGPYGILPVFGFVLFSQIYRYRRVSTLVERQQTKWFLFGVAVFFAGNAVLLLIPNFLRASYNDIIQDIFSVLFLFFPVIVANAILRYRLFDIDLLIRRTLQYSLLSGLLALTYFGLIIVLQSAFTALTGQRQNDFITVASTLAIAALFAPLRRRVQDVIDRRFYRKKYDAAKVIAEYGATCRDETDLDKLTARLVEVVQETMQPESVSLWLKPSPPSPLSRPFGSGEGGGGRGVGGEGKRNTP